MKTITTYRRNPSDTVCGESITLTVRYSSFDKKEIDKLEEKFKEEIGYMQISEGKF